MIINEASARLVFREALAAAVPAKDGKWEPLFRAISETCKEQYRTHIAFLGTALLAKATDVSVDVFAVKVGTGNTKSYAARTLCTAVLVPEAASAGLNIGVSGREPLNNQPYFRIQAVSRTITVRSSAKPALNQLCNILDELAKVSTVADAKAALTAFIRVRKEFTKVFAALVDTDDLVDPEEFAATVAAFVAQKSEGGKRAQAVAAALMDVFVGEDWVSVDKVNDPDRHLPGDVAVKADEEGTKWDRVFEVRDKTVTLGDIDIFIRKCLDNGVEQAAILAVSQDSIPEGADGKFRAAREHGLAIEIYLGWSRFVREVLTWSEQPAMRAAAEATSRIHTRLVELEVEEGTVKAWNELIAPKVQEQPKLVND